MMITPAAVYSGTKIQKNLIFYVKSPHNFRNKKCVAISRKKFFRTFRLNLCIALFSPFLAYFVPSAVASSIQVVCGLISQEDLNQIYMII